MIPQLLNICTDLQDHDQRNLRIDRRQLEQRSRLRKIVSGRIGQVIRHVRWHVVMEVKAELEFAKIFQEGRAHKSHITMLFLVKISVLNPRKGVYHVIANAVDRTRKNIIVILELVIPLPNHP